jgi:hypothetical protein
VLDESLDEASLNELTSVSERPKEVAYNPQIPVETFDFVVVDECHRSIYNIWRQALEYCDAFLVDLTVTPFSYGDVKEVAKGIKVRGSSTGRSVRRRLPMYRSCASLSATSSPRPEKRPAGERVGAFGVCQRHRESSEGLGISLLFEYTPSVSLEREGHLSLCKDLEVFYKRRRPHSSLGFVSLKSY